MPKSGICVGIDVFRFRPVSARVRMRSPTCCRFARQFPRIEAQLRENLPALGNRVDSRQPFVAEQCGLRPTVVEDDTLQFSACLQLSGKAALVSLSDNLVKPQFFRESMAQVVEQDEFDRIAASFFVQPQRTDKFFAQSAGR
jgi:hypothetical protein